MNKFFNYYTSLCVGSNTPTIFSYDPFLIAIKEMLVSELQQVVYYIEKLKDFNINMSGYTDKVIEFISVLIVNLDFNKESFFVIIQDLNKNKIMLEQMYESACQKANVEPQLLEENSEKFSSKESILKALNEHEKNIQVNKVQLSKNKKNLYEIMINLVLNACNCLIELKHYGVDFSEAKNQVLKLLNSSNFPEMEEKNWIDTIKNFSQCNYQIMKTLYASIIETFGPVIETQVPLCRKKGKAILVSGSSFIDIEKLLLAVEGLDINIYTHHEMISAFQYQKLRSYPNLVGHYQKSNNNFPLDFAEFPGPIYVSRNSILKIDVIRGQIYASAKYPAYGIAKIDDNDFSPIIKYALESPGFDEESNVNTIKIGYSQNEIDDNINLILKKIQNHEIDKIVIIGMIDQFNKSNDYITKFFEICPESTFIISFSYFSNRKNFWHVNSYYDFAILYNIIERLSTQISFFADKVSIFLTDCNSGTISHIFNLIYLGFKHIFLGPCCPNVINPVLIDALEDLFNIKPLSTPIDDIEKIG